VDKKTEYRQACPESVVFDMPEKENLVDEEKGAAERLETRLSNFIEKIRSSRS